MNQEELARNSETTWNTSFDNIKMNDSGLNGAPGKMNHNGATRLDTTPPTALVEVEREHILKILGTTSWRIKGPHGAAIKLGLKPSTLYTRMKKLGIPTFTQRESARPERL